MAAIDFRNSNEFDPESFGGQGGGLLGMLRRYTQQQSFQQQGANVGSIPGSAPDYSPEMPIGEESGLLGRMLALQAEQDRYQPRQANGGSAFIPPPDPNFRQLSRVPNPSGAQGAIGPSNQPDDQSYPAYSPFGEGASLDLLRRSQMQQNQYKRSAEFPENPVGTKERVNYDVLADLIGGHESGNRSDAKNPHSSATGFGQFVDRTWLDVLNRHRPDLQGSREQLLALRSNRDLSREMTKAYASDNARMLSNAKLPVTEGNIYLAHFAGPKGAQVVLRADPSTPVSLLLRDGAIKANPFLRNMNASDLQAWAEKVIQNQIKKSASQRATAVQPFPAIPQPPIQVLSPRVTGDPSSLDGAQAWAVPRSAYDPRR